MAKKIEELIVELGIKGLEGLDNLSSSFRNLQKAIGPSDNAITQVRKSILDMSSAGKQSIQMIQGQIDAFKGLQTQATIGSNVYKQLAGDVNRLSDTLKKLKGDYEEVGRAARQTDAQIANQFPARRPEAFRVQLAALNRELGQLSVSARAYGDALTEITIRETAFGRAQARQGAIAGAQAVGAPLIAAMTPQQALPNTTAALRVQLAELTQDFDNLDRSGEQYAQVAQRISEIQEELSRNILGVATAYDRHAAAENAAIRRAEKMRGVQEYYRAGGADRGFRDPATGAMIAGPQIGPGSYQPLRQEPAAPARRTSALFQSIADIGLGGVARDVEMMGRSYADVEGVIRRVSAASDGSIASLQKQRNVWQQLFVQLEPGTAIFKRVEQDIQRLDRRLEKFQSRRRGLGAMGATQAAGAVISGGIFGGPEGAIGGAIGTAMGGVPGAFAGAAIGAQVGSIRQSLGSMAQFTAEIDKQRIALRNVVGDQEAYNNSLRFIDATSRRLAIPQDQLNKQFTQLAASVVGAGGNVDAAKAAFEGIAAGIRGTGGSLQDLQGALLATSQVFGKGKVSAEELRQQIGERMPGAFSIFAESIGKTPQELDKMLSKGEVTLNDFMKFAQELSRRYGQSANEIAASSQSAGDRMQVTFARLREAIGRELQPIGAQFQEIFANFFAENEQAIVDFAKSLAGVMKVFADNAGLISGVLKTLLGFGAIAGTAAVFAQVAAGVATLSAAIVQLGGVAGIASLAMQALLASMAAIPVIGWIGAAVAGLALLGKAVYDTNDTFRNFVDNIGGVVANDFRYAVTGMANDAKASTDQIQAAFDGLNKYFESTSSFVRQLFGDTFSSVSQSGQTSAGQLDNSFSIAFSNITSQGAAAFNGLSTLITNWYNQLPDPIRNILGGNTASILVGAAGAAGSAARRASQGKPERQGPYVPDRIKNAIPITPATFTFPTGDTQGGSKAGGAKGAKGPESRAAELKLDLHLREQMLEAESMIAQARLDGDERLVAMLTTLQAQTRLVTEAAKVELDKIPAQDKALRLRILEQDSLQESAKQGFVLAELEKKATEELRKSMEQISKQVDEFKNRAAFEREYGELIMQGSLPATARQYLETKRVVEESIKAAEAAILKAEASNADADAIEKQRKELERIRGAGQEELGRIQGGDDPSAVISGAITRIKGELNELLNLGNQVVGAATAIGDAFGNSFKGLISGSMSAKEALRSFFQSTADYFLDMASQMIAKWITMKLIGLVGGLFGGGASAPLGFGGAGDPLGAGGAFWNANGNAFAQNGIVPYAKGGVVNRPTMFKFANGGAMQNGVMGEAGPEAIMPLKRGADGKLGVTARMDGAMSRYRRPPGTMAAAADGMAATEGAAPAAVNGAIDVRYTVERINSVDYVTADQFQQGMQQAAMQGAQRGEQMVLRKLQQSPSTRRRVGVS